MGITAMIPDMTIGQLTTEATARWGEIWDPHATRMTILLLCPRKERKMMELHGDMVEHGQPVMTVFHRPRAEAHLLEEQGFDPWMQHLVTNEGWVRNSIELASTPFSVGLPTQRAFEASQTLCFRHPSLPVLERYYLPFPPESLPGKCFVSLPRRAAAEMARQQAEILGVGRLEKPVPEPAPAPPPAPAPEPVEEPTPPAEASAEEEPEPVQEPPQTDEATTVPLPPTAAPVDEEEAAPVPLPATDEVQAEPTPTAPPVAEEQATVELPETEEEVVEMSDLEAELRTFFQELIDAGVEPSAFMDDPRWEDLNERAIAEGLETWPILLQMTAMG